MALFKNLLASTTVGVYPFFLIFFSFSFLISFSLLFLFSIVPSLLHVLTDVKCLVTEGSSVCPFLSVSCILLSFSLLFIPQHFIALDSYLDVQRKKQWFFCHIYLFFISYILFFTILSAHIFSSGKFSI